MTFQFLRYSLNFLLGTRQSPINIENKYTSILTDKSVSVDGIDLASGTLEYNGDDKLQIVDTRLAELHYRSKEEDRDYVTNNIHWHAPSEHAVDGSTSALEAHTVFTRQGRGYADYLVVGVMYELDTGASNDSFISSLNLDAFTAGTSATQTVTNVPFKDFYSWASPREKYNYHGSLTTPNCSENVEWFVVKERRKINSAQLSLFTRNWADRSAFAGGNGNNRILMPLGERQVYVTHGEKSKPLVLLNLPIPSL